MLFIYCSFSPNLHRRLPKKKGFVMKFGRTDDLAKRLESMQEGWLQPDGRRGPALALENDWIYVSHLEDRFDSESRLLDTALGAYGLAVEGRQIAHAMTRAALPGLAGQTNGVGELRRFPRRWLEPNVLQSFCMSFDSVIAEVLFEASAFARELQANEVRVAA